MEITVFWLALTFGIHIVMVNLGIFLALTVPYFKHKAEVTGDKALEKVAWKMMRFYAATYGVAGVFGTAYTVFLLSYYPDFIGLAGNITMIPFGLSIILITLHFFSISSYYYGWRRWSRSTHDLIGALLAITALLIPFGFRAVFAFLNIPVGLHVEGGKIFLSMTEALSNSTFWPLYFKSIVAAITAGSIAVIAGLEYSYNKSSDEWYREGVKKVVSALSPVAAVGLLAMVVLGLWYAYSLRAVPYKFNNIFASIGWKVGDGTAYNNVTWLFILKMIFFAIQVIVVFALYKHLRGGVLPQNKVGTMLATGFIALSTIALGEYLNAFSQYPCFIAALAGPGGCNVPASLPSSLQTILSLKTYNEIATIGSVTGITVAFMIFLLSSAAYFFYALLMKPERLQE
jgi:cytochrome d ubiquinol oxidase subunit I